MVGFKKKLNYFLLFSFNFCFLNLAANEVFETENVKSVFVPASDAMPLRYNYNEDFLKEDNDCWEFSPSLKYRYQRTFNDEKNAAMFFGDSRISASNFSNRDEKPTEDIYAGTMKFDKDFKSIDEFKIGIQNHYIDIGLNVSIPNSDFYFFVGVPIQNNIVKRKNNEKNTVGISTASSKSINSLKNYLAGKVSGDMQARKFAKFQSNCSTNKWGVAGVPVQIGWNGWKRDTSHLGFYLRTVFPTGTKLDSCWASNAFSPFVGNGRSWEFDLGINSHIDIFEKEKWSMRLDLDWYLGHVFKGKQCRTFDFRQGVLTRYANIKAFDKNLNYANEAFWGADLTTQNVNVGVPLKTEFVLNSVFISENCKFNLGYSFKGQQKEQLRCNLKINDNNIYGLAHQINSTDLSTKKITPNSGIFNVSFDDFTMDNSGTKIYGTEINSLNSLKGSDINVESGIMNSQTNHILFTGYKHSFDCCDRDFTFGINGSVGLSSKASYSPEFWDLGISLETDF